MVVDQAAREVEDLVAEEDLAEGDSSGVDLAVADLAGGEGTGRETEPV